MAQSLAQKMGYLAQKHEKAAFILSFCLFLTLLSTSCGLSFFSIRTTGKGFLSLSFLLSVMAKQSKAKPNQAARSFFFPFCH